MWIVISSIGSTAVNSLELKNFSLSKTQNNSKIVEVIRLIGYEQSLSVVPIELV